MVAVDFNCALGGVPGKRRKTGEYICSHYAMLPNDFIEYPAGG